MVTELQSIPVRVGGGGWVGGWSGGQVRKYSTLWPSYRMSLSSGPSVAIVSFEKVVKDFLWVLISSFPAISLQVRLSQPSLAGTWAELVNSLIYYVFNITWNKLLKTKLQKLKFQWENELAKSWHSQSQYLLTREATYLCEAEIGCGGNNTNRQL